MSSFSVVNDSLSLSDVNQLQVTPIGLKRIDPATKTANFVVTSLYDTYSVNGATGVVLPSAISSIGRILHFKTSPTAATLGSITDITSGTALSNVYSATGVLGSSIISTAVNGNSATLVSNGVNWYNIKNVTVA